jgi:hypothetical protein
MREFLDLAQARIETTYVNVEPFTSFAILTNRAYGTTIAGLNMTASAAMHHISNRRLTYAEEAASW